MLHSFENLEGKESEGHQPLGEIWGTYLCSQTHNRNWASPVGAQDLFYPRAYHLWATAGEIVKVS